MDGMAARGADTQFQAGLEGVVASSSAICFVDGQEGRLLYRGYDIHDLAEHSTFEEVVYLLWHGDLPARAQLDALCHELGAVRALPAASQGLLTGLPRAAGPMDVLRTVVSALGLYDPDLHFSNPAANRLTSGRPETPHPISVASYHRVRQGK